MALAAGRLGRIGEAIAARHIAGQGLVVLDRNWRFRLDDLRGELDLVAQDGDVLVVVEVKTRRRPTPAGPLEAITPTKLMRLRRLAAAWLAEDGRRVVGVRIDAVGVHWPEGGGGPVVEHLVGIDA